MREGRKGAIIVDVIMSNVPGLPDHSTRLGMIAPGATILLSAI